MNRTTRFFIDDENARDQRMNDIEIQRLDNSMLVIAKRKIVIPDSKIIMESAIALSSLQCQPLTGEEYGRISTRIILTR